jgi:hypothetical protein
MSDDTFDMERAAAFTREAFHFVGDIGAWLDDTGPAEQRETMDRLAAVCRDEFGREAGMLASRMILAAQFLAELAAGIGHQTNDARPYLIAFADNTARLHALIVNAFPPRDDDEGAPS